MLKTLALMAGPLLALAIATSALAQPAACRTQGDAAAIPINSHSGVTQQDLALSLKLGAATLPAVTDKATRDIPCSRGAMFRAGADDYTLTGENTDDLPRRAVASRADAPVYYLTAYDPPPPPPGAIGAPAAAPKGKAYVLVQSTGGRSAGAWRLFTAIPPDDILKIAIQDIAASAARPLAGYDGQRNQIYVVSTPAGGAPAAGAARPAQLPPGVRQLTSPDGTIFVDAGQGGALHKASGFTCPASFLGFARRDMIIYDPSANGRDVGCGYGPPGGSSWYTLYLTSFPDASNEAIFRQWTQEAQTVSPVVRTVDPPLATGPRPLPTSAAFWTDSAGRIQGLWVSTIGIWHVNLRVTLSPGKEAEAAEMARTVFAAFYSEVGAQLSSR